jgi:hypothetical protein
MAKGKIVVRDGDVRTLEGWQVQFRSTADPTLLAAGVIEDDGRFGLAFYDGQNNYHPGIREGDYVVRLAPPEGARANVLARVHPRYLKFETSGLTCSVVAGKEDQLRFELEPGR